MSLLSPNQPPNLGVTQRKSFYPSPAERGASNGKSDWSCECGKGYHFSSYVMAHWGTTLRHECDCGSIHDIRSGIVTKAAGIQAEAKK